MTRRALPAALLLAALLAAPPAADAQLYRWRDPETGSVKLSSVPPPWYRRGVSNGPHVEVIVAGKAVDPLAASSAAAAPGAGTGPLPPPRMAPPPPGAGKEQLAAAVIAGLRVNEQFAGWSGAVSAGLEEAMRARDLPPATREALREAAAAAFRSDRLQAVFAKAFLAEVSEADLREVIDIEQTPLARRVAAMEPGRGGRPLPDLQQLAALESRTSAERRALAESIEEAVRGADLLAASVAAAAAAFALTGPEDQRTKVAEVLQQQRAALLPKLRQLFVRLVLYAYEPLSDQELRAVLDLQRRPAVARINRAVGLGYATVVQEGLTDFIGAARPIVARR